MAPQMKVPCFAVKDKTAKVERWEFEPAPLQAGDIGTVWFTPCIQSVRNSQRSEVVRPNMASAEFDCRDPSDAQRAMPLRRARCQIGVGSHKVPHGTWTRGSALAENPSHSVPPCSTC